MDEIDIPQYFICPISLQIMKDPVTAISGITYDRESIEHWLSASVNATCPVTKQPLPTDSDLTPNHTLRRLIQAWCITNAHNGINQICTPKSHVFKLIHQLSNPPVCHKALKELLELANVNEKNKTCMVEAGVIKAMILLVTRSCKERKTSGLEEALKILHLIWTPTVDVKLLVRDSNEILESLLWVFRLHLGINVKTQALLVLKLIIEATGSTTLDRLKLGFINEIVKVLEIGTPTQSIKAVLQILIEACPWGRNQRKIVESGAVFRLINLELNNSEKKITELIFCLLAHLCSCADGRAQLLDHGGGIAVVSKRILRVSPGTDDRAIRILSQISRFSPAKEVLMEMLGVGAVSKLCMVLQADCAKHLKDRARKVLRLHSNVWSNSPCIAVYLLTKDPR